MGEEGEQLGNGCRAVLIDAAEIADIAQPAVVRVIYRVEQREHTVAVLKQSAVIFAAVCHALRCGIFGNFADGWRDVSYGALPCLYALIFGEEAPRDIVAHFLYAVGCRDVDIALDALHLGGDILLKEVRTGGVHRDFKPDFTGVIDKAGRVIHIAAAVGRFVAVADFHAVTAQLLCFVDGVKPSHFAFGDEAVKAVCRN